MKINLILALALVLVFQASASVIGIDLGSQYIKAVAIKPGMPFFTVLDEASKRKSLSLVSFDSKQRFIGNAGEALAVKSPEAAFMWIHRLLGKPFGCELQQNIIDAGFPYSFSRTERGTIAVQVDDVQYTVEELVAMQLRMIKQNAFVQSGSVINDAVITVPPYFSQVERQAVYDAAAIAGLKVISLINDNSAAAIEYGRERTYSLNETHTACIFNVGASATTATVVKYSAYPVKNGLVNVPTGQFEVLGNGFNDKLGGNAFDTRLTFYLADKFQVQVTNAGFNVDVKTLPRVMARLRGAAQKAKEVLSANQECQVRIESLYDELDFKHVLDRDTFHEISKDLFDSVTPVVTRALEDAKVSTEDINAFVLVGGGSRVPRIQDILKSFTAGNELDQSLNADEAISFGAALFAANNSVSFRVRKFGYIDKLQYPVGARITERREGENDPRSKRFSVYSKHSRVDSQRHIEVPYESDVLVDLHYDETNLPVCTDTKIAQYEVSGIAQACSEYKKHGNPSVHLTFDLKPDGIVSLISGEVSVTFTEMEPVPSKRSSKKDDKPDEESEPEMQAISKTLRTALTVKKKTSGELLFLDNDMMNASKKVVDSLDERDNSIRDIAAARNHLESHIYETRSKLDDETVKMFSTPEARETVSEKLDAAELWLEDNFELDQASDFKNKLSELKSFSDDIFFRIKEADFRTFALSGLAETVANTSKSLKKIRAKMDWIPKELVDNFEKLVNETSEWLDSKNSEHLAMDPTENPKFLAADVDSKKQQLIDRINLLYQFPKPPPKPASSSQKNRTESSKFKKSKASESTDEPPESDSTETSEETFTESSSESSEETLSEHATSGSDEHPSEKSEAGTESNNERGTESSEDSEKVEL